MRNENLFSLFHSGLSVIPTQEDKRPAILSWQEFQAHIPTPVDAISWPPAYGLGIICGKVSGGLFCIDIDEKNDPEKKLMREYSSLIREQAPDLLSRVVIERTPSGGFHMIARCTTPLRNIKLAKSKTREVLIETRGEGGYFCADPTPGYKLLRGSFDAIPTVTPEELDILLDCARALSQEAKESEDARRQHDPIHSGLSPFDDYDARTSAEETGALLESYGWKIMFRRGAALYLKRPGKAGRALSATFNHIPGRLYVFTTSTSFESEHVYKPCAVYAMLEHGGNYTDAAKALAAKGYGQKPKAPEPQPMTTAAPNDILTRILDIYDNGMKIGASPGWPLLAKHYQIIKGQLNVFTGIPSHGKSEFTDALMVNLAQKQAWNFVVYSPENYPTEIHVRKLAEKLVGKNMFGAGRMSRESLIEATAWVTRHFTFLDGVDEDVTLTSIFEAVLEQKKKRPVDGVIIDPWNELESTRPEKVTETDFIGICLKRARMFARKHDVWFAIVAHPTKMRKDPKTGEYPIPTLYDISGSAHWYNKADNGIVIHRDYEQHTTHVIVQKIKFKYYGKPGDVEMKYDPVSGRYSELTVHDHFIPQISRQTPPEPDEDD